MKRQIIFNGFKNEHHKRMGLLFVWAYPTPWGGGFHFITDPMAIRSLCQNVNSIRICIKDKLFIGWVR